MMKSNCERVFWINSVILGEPIRRDESITLWPQVTIDKFFISVFWITLSNGSESVKIFAKPSPPDKPYDSWIRPFRISASTKRTLKFTSASDIARFEATVVLPSLGPALDTAKSLTAFCRPNHKIPIRMSRYASAEGDSDRSNSTWSILLLLWDPFSLNVEPRKEIVPTQRLTSSSVLIESSR